MTGAAAVALLALVLAVDGQTLFDRFNHVKAPGSEPVAAVRPVKSSLHCEMLCLDYGANCTAANVIRTGRQSYSCEIIPNSDPAALRPLEPNLGGRFMRKTDDSDDCASSPCQNRAVCTDVGLRYRCRCVAVGVSGVNCQLTSV